MGGEPVDAAALRGALDSRWQRIDVIAEIGSTNAELLADADAPDRSVLVAEHQTSGRGRLDRAWTSPPGAGLTFSVLVRPTPPIPTWGWLPLLAGVALRDAVAATTGVPVVLKWPNDLLYEPTELKLAGILAQTSGPAVVIGIGLNVSMSEDELPVGTATSLALCGADVDRTRLLVEILIRLDDWLHRWSEADGVASTAGLADAYREACATLGRRVSVSTTSGTVVVGVAQDLDPDGRLVLDVDGESHAIGAGDVEHLRADDSELP